MSQLQHTLEALEANQLNVVQTNPALFTQFCLSESPLFERAMINKPERHANQHLLGLLTKAHLELSSALQHQQEKNLELQTIMRNTLGESGKSKFQDQSLQQFELVCHLWFYLQGCLGMDFSLANDHAEQSAQIICTLRGGEHQPLRAGMMASFYSGRDYRQRINPQQTCWQKIRSYWRR